MELNFPFKNMAINGLIDFVDPYKFQDYIAANKDSDSNAALNFNSSIEIYESGLPNFENELIQVINTTDQQTIDTYFRVLADEIDYIKETVAKGNILTIITEYNRKSIERFEKEVEAKTREYWKSDKRQLEHLQEYEGFDHFAYLMLDKAEPIKYINYNFYCIEEKLKYIDTTYTDVLTAFINDLTEKFFDIAYRYGRQWKDGKIKSKHISFIKPILFVEGELDIDYIYKAAELLGKRELLAEIDIRQRAGFHNLDKLWNIYKTDNWETVPQKKIFLYDCDTEKTEEDNIYNYKRVIPTLPGNPIKKGIENLFSEDLLQKAVAAKSALMDKQTIIGTKRGEAFKVIEYSIDKMEKRNLCDWICSNATAADFQGFTIIFEIIAGIIND